VNIEFELDSGIKSRDLDVDVDWIDLTTSLNSTSFKMELECQQITCQFSTWRLCVHVSILYRFPYYANIECMS